MQWEAASLFATPVFKFSMGDMQNLTEFFHNTIKNEVGDERDAQGELSHYFSRYNVFEKYSELAALQSQLTQMGSFVYRDLMHHQKSGELYFTNAWFNLCEIGGSQPAHNHVNCLLCGTLYLHADDMTHLNFYHPLNNSSFHSELYDRAADDMPNKHGLKFHRREAKISVKSGDCLFWPSWLKHGYHDNQTPGRLSLSFNMMPDKLNVDYQPFMQS